MPWLSHFSPSARIHPEQLSPLCFWQMLSSSNSFGDGTSPPSLTPRALEQDKTHLQARALGRRVAWGPCDLCGGLWSLTRVSVELSPRLALSSPAWPPHGSQGVPAPQPGRGSWAQRGDTSWAGTAARQGRGCGTGDTEGVSVNVSVPVCVLV